MLELRQIEVQTAQGESIAVVCRDVDVSEQSSVTNACVNKFSIHQRKANRDRPMAEHIQPCPVGLVSGLSAARICQLPGSGLPAIHGRSYAVVSYLAQSKIPVSALERPQLHC